MGNRFTTDMRKAVDDVEDKSKVTLQNVAEMNPKCRCNPCKCNPCRCGEETTEDQSHGNGSESTIQHEGQQLDNIEDGHKEHPESDVKNGDAEKVGNASEVNEPKNPKCHCNPCECNPCRCGEETTEDQTNADHTKVTVEDAGRQSDNTGDGHNNEDGNGDKHVTCDCNLCQCNPCKCDTKQNQEHVEENRETEVNNSKGSCICNDCQCDPCNCDQKQKDGIGSEGRRCFCNPCLNEECKCGAEIGNKVPQEINTQHFGDDEIIKFGN